ncbi:hypothetical protein ACFE04_007395 [Oxalis oulophora]
MESQSKTEFGDLPETLPTPLFKDIRRYYCEYCGICRSKKTLITSHILSHHKDEMEETSVDQTDEEKSKLNTCEDCGATFKKPAHLKQHMQSHSMEHWIPVLRTPKCDEAPHLIGLVLGGRPPEKLHQRPFACPIDDCRSRYRRKDHLNRHLLSHKGKLFKCPNEKCNLEFVFQGNMTRHVKEFHEDGSIPANKDEEKYVCQEIGCGKVFKYASKLKKHADSHVKLDSVEAFCAEPGCMKYFTNEECLKAHKQSCHQHVTCDVCGTKQLKKNIQRHLRTHEEADSSLEKIECEFDGCLHTFSTQANLRKHIKAVHAGIKPFICCFSGCGMRFAYKHVRDRHEKSGCHVYTPGDFVESDENFRSMPRGGRKRVCPSLESLMRKRISPPSNFDLIFEPQDETGNRSETC